MKHSVSDAPFKAAHAKFTAANATAQAMQARHEDAAARLLQAKLESAAAQSKVEAFATGPDTSVQAAQKLAAHTSQAEQVAALMERAVEHLAGELNQAKADVLLAERECLAAQAAYHDAVCDALAESFLLEHAAELQKMAQAMHASGLFSTAHSNKHGLAHAAQFCSGRPEWLFERVLPDALARTLGKDENFRARCSMPTGPAINQEIRSPLVVSKERGATQYLLNPDRASIVRALNDIKPDPEPTFDLGHAVESAKHAAKRAESLRAEARRLEEKLAQRPGDPNLIEGVAEYTALAEHAESVVASWDEQITAHREQYAA